MDSIDEAAAILNHYFAALTRQCGLRWTERNQADIARACDLLAQADAQPDLDSIPPYERPVVSDRVTQVIDRDELDPASERWRRERRDDADAARRMLRREERGR